MFGNMAGSFNFRALLNDLLLLGGIHKELIQVGPTSTRAPPLEMLVPGSGHQTPRMACFGDLLVGNYRKLSLGHTLGPSVPYLTEASRHSGEDQQNTKRLWNLRVEALGWCSV